MSTAVRLYWVEIEAPAPAIVSPGQVLLPVGDTSDGAWTGHDGGTNLWSYIDESVAADADYVQSSLSGGADAESRIRIAPGLDPGVDSGHVVRYRYAKDDVGGDVVNLRVRLYDGDGVTLIAERTHSDIPANWTDGSFTLTGPEADAITDYASGLVIGLLRT